MSLSLGRCLIFVTLLLPTWSSNAMIYWLFLRPKHIKPQCAKYSSFIYVFDFVEMNTKEQRVVIFAQSWRYHTVLLMRWGVIGVPRTSAPFGDG
jgi:hypothetical protein